MTRKRVMVGILIAYLISAFLYGLYLALPSRLEVTGMGTFTVSDWKISVTGIGQSYSYPDDVKLVVIRVEVKNDGFLRAKYLRDIRDFVLVTDAGKVYEYTDIYNLKLWRQASSYIRSIGSTPYDGSVKVPPGTRTEFSLAFEIPVKERIAELRFKLRVNIFGAVGGVGGLPIRVIGEVVGGPTRDIDVIVKLS